MDYKALSNSQLSALLVYGHCVQALSTDLIEEIANRLDPDRVKQAYEVTRGRYLKIVQTHNFIEAIKQYRTDTGAPLKDAKDIIERFMQECGIDKKSVRSGGYGENLGS